MGTKLGLSFSVLWNCGTFGAFGFLEPSSELSMTSEALFHLSWIDFKELLLFLSTVFDKIGSD